MNKKLLLFAVLSLIVMSASAQLKRSMAAHAPTRPQAQLVKPEAVMERAEMRQPSTPVVKPPMRADSVDVWYRRPAGAFAGIFIVEDGAYSGSSYAPFIFVKPYSEYTFNGFATGVSDAATYGWSVMTGGEDWTTIPGKDLTWKWGLEENDVPIFHVDDGVNSKDWFIHGSYDNQQYTSKVCSWPYFWDEYVDLLVSSKTFCYGGRHGDQRYPMSYYSGIDPYGNNEDGWWFGKNGGYSDYHIDGIAQAFEKPEHPYLLKQVVMYTALLEAAAPVEMTCRIYKLNGIPAYDESSSVILPEVPGELICEGKATVTPETDNITGGLVFFTLYGQEDDLVYELTPTIDDAILVVIDGYNDPAMENLTDFSALVSTDDLVDEGFGELAYLKYGNSDGDYFWVGLNNFFSIGELKTGFSIFLTIDQPFIIFNDENEDGQYTFPDEGGMMEKDLGNGLCGLEFLSSNSSDYFWVESYYNNIYYEDGLPGWLHIEAVFDELDDDNYSYPYHVTFAIFADTLPAGIEYREATAYFSIPGAAPISYTFKQGAGDNPSGTNYYIVGSEPFGDWHTNAGSKMSQNSDVTYSYTAAIDGTTCFVFADGLTEYDGDWDTFNSQYRYGPTGGVDQAVEVGTWYSTQRQYDSNGAYMFTGNGSEYVFTFNPNINKFKIDLKVNKTARPVITSFESVNGVKVTATGKGHICLYLYGALSAEGENKAEYIIPYDTYSKRILVSATAQESGKLVSDHAYLLVTVPAHGDPGGYLGGGTEFFYMDDINVTAYRGKTVTVDMKAHFEASVSAAEVELVDLPSGLTVESAVEGSDLTLTYTTATGEESQTTASLSINQDKTRFIVFNAIANYWDPDDDGVYESQGVVKWGPGVYNQMWTMTFKIPEDFAGGDIVILTDPYSGPDANPEVNLTERETAYYLCHFTVDEEYQKTATPLISSIMDPMTGTWYVDIYPDEDNCDIYYRYIEYNSGTTTEWMLYDGQLEFSEIGHYRIEAYAVASGKQPSDPAVCEFYNTGPIYTDMPTITAEETDDAVIVTATGDGTVILYKDGVQVQNPCVIPKQEETVTYTFTATAQYGDYHVSQEATLVVTVPGYGSGVTIYVKANRAPHLFSWVETIPGSWIYPLGDWPGSVISDVITVNRVQYYTYTFDPYPSVNIIFNNGNDGYGNQTGDFVNITEDAFFVYNGGGLAYGVIPPTVYGNPTGEYAFYVNTDQWSHVNAVLDGVEYPMTLVGTDGAGFEVYKWELNMITPPSRITFNDGAGHQVVDVSGTVYSSDYVKGGYYIYTFFAEKMYASLDMPTIITYEGEDQRPVVEDCAIELKSSNEVWNGYNDVAFRITGTYFNPSARQGRVLYSVDGGDWVEFTSLLNSEQTFDENVILSFNPDVTRHTIRLAAQDLSGAYSTIVTVLEVTDASALECRNLPELYYTGQPLTFEPLIYDPYNYMLLTFNEDYTISFSDNVNVGPATLHVQAIYPAIIGETTFTFTILPHPISGEAYTVGEPFYYTGSAITPTVVVIDDLLGELTPGEDYTVTYIDNVEIGQAYAVVEGIGRCTGEITVPFEILDPPMNERDWNIIKMFYNQYQNDQFVWNVTDPVSAKYNPGLIEENQRVIGIELSDKGLEGSFPTMLLSLDELLTLDLSYNNLSGDAASDMVQYDAAEGITATGLQNLLINNNEFTGNVGAMAALFGNLENLNVSVNHFDMVYPMVNPNVSLSLNEQLLEMEADITLGIESLINSVPSICLYDHAAQTFLTNLEAQLTDETQSPEWNMSLSFNDGAFSITASNPYRGLNGQILDGYTWLNSSWTNEQLLKLKFIFAPGDANINGPVDITDLQAMVNYIFGEYNRPFNYTAANLNNDNTVNVQDVVGEANLLLSMDLTKSMPNLRQAPAMESLPVNASLYWSDGVLYLHTTVPVAALDILNDVNGDIKWNVADYGMVVKTTRGAQGEHTVIYSLGDAVIPPGVTAIATTTVLDATVVAAKLSDTEADLVRVKLNDGFTNLSGIPTDGSVQCRLDGNTLIINSGNALTDVNIGVYTIDGKVVADKHLSHLDSGQSRINLSNMADDNGYFIIVVRNGRQVIATQKLTKIR